MPTRFLVLVLTAACFPEIGEEPDATTSTTQPEPDGTSQGFSNTSFMGTVSSPEPEPSDPTLTGGDDGCSSATLCADSPWQPNGCPTALSCEDITKAIPCAHASLCDYVECANTVAEACGQDAAAACLRIARCLVEDPRTCLRITEVFYDAPSGSQWISLHNGCIGTLDLTHVRLAWTGARALWSFGELPLVKWNPTFAALGCWTGGGPATSPANFDPILSMPLQLDPPLAIPSDGGAEGVGLFFADDPAPFDAVVYGASNVKGIPGVGGDPATPHVGASGPSRTIQKIGGVWEVEDVGTPNDCSI